MRTDNPTLLRLYRSERLESIHRGAWVLSDGAGTVIDNAGDPNQPIFARSASKSLQALPLIESGAADRYGFDERNLALALASHSGQTRHVDVAADGLAKIGLDEDALRCGPQRPSDSKVSTEATRITNNCSGKHVGFLAVAKHIGADPATYLDRNGEVQRMVRSAVQEMTGSTDDELDNNAVDGCSAPTFHLPLVGLATGLARVTNPAGLDTTRAAACRRLTNAAGARPDLVAGTHERFCTDLISATNGRIFGKIGAEGVYALGVVGDDVGLACKVDDGNARGCYALIIHLLVDRGLMSSNEAATLTRWGNTTLYNWDGLETGHAEIGEP